LKLDFADPFVGNSRKNLDKCRKVVDKKVFNIYKLWINNYLWLIKRG